MDTRFYFHMWNKVVVFLKSSNHWKHILGGLLVAIPCFSWWRALWIGVVAGACLEYKDKAYGSEWDWTDFACTVLGSAIPAISYLFL